MPQNIHAFNQKTTAKAQVLKPKFSSSMMLLSLLGLWALFYTYQAYAGESVASSANLYAQHYVAQSASHLKSLNQTPNTQLELRNNQEEDNTLMLENGYDMMGTSTFITANVADNLALQHGQAIQADKVLIYNKGAPLKTKIVRLDGDKAGEKAAQDANNESEQNPQKIYYASYWAKLPTPTLGVHIIKLIPAENKDGAMAEEVKGLTVIAVIKESPAAKASILKGDNLLKIGELTLEKPDDLFAAVKQYAGQSVPVEVQRGQDIVKMRVALNARK